MNFETRVAAEMANVSKTWPSVRRESRINDLRQRSVASSIRSGGSLPMSSLRPGSATHPRSGSMTRPHHTSPRAASETSALHPRPFGAGRGHTGPGAGGAVGGAPFATGADGARDGGVGSTGGGGGCCSRRGRLGMSRIIRRCLVLRHWRHHLMWRHRCQLLLVGAWKQTCRLLDAGWRGRRLRYLVIGLRFW